MLSDEETWKDIKGYEGLYEVSNLGRIRSLDRYKNTKGRYGIIKAKIKGRLLKPCLNHDGYEEIVLSKDGKSKMYRLHRIVAETFINNFDNKNQVNHKNGNKLDNKVKNLEWCNCKDNIHHALKNNLMKPAKGKEHYMAKEVGKYNENNQLIEKYDTIVQAGKLNKISDTNIIHCLKGRTKKAGGYKWKYMD